MEYRKLARGHERISTLGIGGEYLIGLPPGEVEEIIGCAIENGINMLDLYMPEPEIRSNLGRALAGRRERMLIQGHICTICETGPYERTRNLEKARRSFEDLLERLKTDFIDFGIIHYIDDEPDLETVMRNGILDYARGLKAAGTIRHLGFSSHNPVMARRLIDTGEFDSLMFSINPAYDLDTENNEDIEALMEFRVGDSARQPGPAPLRASLYAECERRGIGITVMKALAAGRLLSAADSPFGEALSVVQCLHYCLTRPAVLSCMLGVRSRAELEAGLAYYRASDAERDYTAIARSPRYAMAGKCMYCNHCLSCPAGIDIAAVNKLLDLATVGRDIPATVRDHYLSLQASASDCTECGACEKRCPFGVAVIERMRQASSVFHTSRAPGQGGIR